MTLLFYAKHAALLLLVLAAAVGAGTLASGRRGPLALRAALGLALWAETLFLLAALGWLRPLPVLILALAALAGCRPERGQAWVLVTIPLLFLALHPPLAFDETLYHLPFVRSLATTGELHFLETLRFPVFPQFQELLSAPLFWLAGDTATHLLPLAQTFVTAALVWTWAAGYSRRAALLAVALFIGGPIVIHHATILYVEPAMMLFVVAGFYCLDTQWRRDTLVCSPRNEESRQECLLHTSRQECLLYVSRQECLLYVAAGLFLGAACSVKYLGGFFAVAALLILLVGRRWRGAGIFAAGCAVAALPTTLWLVITTGNPVFPFASPLFGVSPWTIQLEGGSAIRSLSVLWNATFARDLVNEQPPMTPLLIPIVLAVTAASVRNRSARALMLMGTAFVTIFTFLPQDTRYLMPLLPLFCVAAAATVAPRIPRWTMLAALVACAPSILYIGWRLAVLGPPPVTAEARERLLEARIPGYRALMIAGKSRVYTCRGEHLQYYAPGQLLGDFNGPHNYEHVLSSNDTATLAARLGRLRVDYYLVLKGDCPPRQQNGGLELVFEDSGAQLWRVARSAPPLTRRFAPPSPRKRGEGR